MDSTEWQKKTLEQLTSHELAWAHLGIQGHYRLKDSELVSVLPAIMGEIRQAVLLAGTQNFIPVAGLFAVLDQIGYAYSSDLKTVYPHDNASGIKKSLYYFTSYSASDNEIKTLY